MPRPLAVYCSTDGVASQVCGLLFRDGVHVPTEVAVLGTDNFDLTCELCSPPLSSIAVPGERLGYEAARRLHAMMDDRPAPEPVVLPPIGVVERQSTCAAAVDDPKIAQAVAFMRDHARERITVGEVIDAVGLPRSSFHYRFAKAMDASPSEVLYRFRIEAAKQRLAETDQSVYTVALETGFPDAEAMARRFRSELGVTPTGYRKRHRV